METRVTSSHAFRTLGRPDTPGETSSSSIWASRTLFFFLFSSSLSCFNADLPRLRANTYSHQKRVSCFLSISILLSSLILCSFFCFICSKSNLVCASSSLSFSSSHVPLVYTQSGRIGRGLRSNGAGSYSYYALTARCCLCCCSCCFGFLLWLAAEMSRLGWCRGDVQRQGR